MNPESRTLSHIVAEMILEQRWKRWVWTVIGLIVFFWLAYLVREIWMPLAIAFLIAMVLDPVVDKLERKGFSRLMGTVLIFASFFTVASVTLYFAVPAVAHQASTVSNQISPYMNDKSQQKLNEMLDRAKVPGYVRVGIQRGVTQLNEGITHTVNWFGTHAMEVMSNLIWLVIIPIVTFYALKDFHLILAKGLLLVPRAKRDFVQTMVSEVTVIFAKYMRALIFLSVLNGLITWFSLWLLGTPNAFMLGVIAAVLYNVPYIGALATTVMIGGFAFIAGGVQYMLLVVMVSLFLQQVLFDLIIAPRILGGRVGLHPILAIVALLAGNVLFGVIGMVLAVPVAASIQLVVLALVPKLRHEIDLAAHVHETPDTTEKLTKETKQTHEKTDASEELHQSVSDAVNNIEKEVARMEAMPSTLDPALKPNILD